MKLYTHARKGGGFKIKTGYDAFLDVNGKVCRSGKIYKTTDELTNQVQQWAERSQQTFCLNGCLNITVHPVIKESKTQSWALMRASS